LNTSIAVKSVEHMTPATTMNGNVTDCEQCCPVELLFLVCFTLFLSYFLLRNCFVAYAQLSTAVS